MVDTVLWKGVGDGVHYPCTLTSLGWFFHHDGMYGRKRPLTLCVLCACSFLKKVHTWWSDPSISWVRDTPLLLSYLLYKHYFKNIQSHIYSSWCPNHWGRRLEGWPNTAARLAGKRRVTQQGVILYLMDVSHHLPNNLKRCRGQR